MIKDSSIILSALIIGITSGLAIYFFWRRRHQNSSVLRSVDPKELHIVSNSEQWTEAYGALSKDILVIKALGFDCEWVNENGCARPVSLLQLASSSGTCVLVRMHLLAKAGFPVTLQKLLADRSILKVGVASLDDGKKLERDYGLCCEGCIDLRLVATRSRIVIQSKGLKAMAKEILGVELDKSVAVRLSNWEADSFTPEQVRYAARDAMSAICILMKMVYLKNARRKGQLSEAEFGKWVASFCQGMVDVRYCEKSKAKKERAPSVDVNPAISSPAGTRAYVTRKKPLYHNCQLISPDGQLLCTCDLKKAQWYLQKELGVRISDNPLKIQLKFEPAGRPLDEKNYYLQEKNNVCVVCGASDSYIRKNVIPHEYRKHFPSIMKEHKSHDIVLMCTSCHMRSNQFDGKLKERLARMYSAEQTTGKHFHSADLTKVKSAAKALMLNSSQIPEQRQKELEQVIRDYYGVPDVDADLLKLALNLDTRLKKDDYCEHGLKVVQHVIEHEGLVAFERMWRQHFLDKMQPAFLPDLWSVDHSHDELISLGLAMKEAVAANCLTVNDLET